MVLLCFCKICVSAVWPRPAYSVSSTYVDLNFPASSNPSSTRYSIFIQREGEDIFNFLASYQGNKLSFFSCREAVTELVNILACSELYC